MGSVCYDPETIEMMKTVLERAWASLPDSRRSADVKSELAQRILTAAASGERDPDRLRMRALLRPMVEPRAILEANHTPSML
jgi:hypothetical protein